MFQNDLLSGVAFVLYQPQDIVNVGGVVRVMSNFGLRDLRLVEPAVFDPYKIEGIAHHTREVVEGVRFYKTLEEAIADCGFVLGTTARPRGTRRERLTPRLAAHTVLAAKASNPGNKSAILFGREDDGLPNNALDHCHALVTIPTDTFNPSLNLAQANLILAYELWLAANPRLEQDQPLPRGAQEQVTGIPPKWGDTPSVVAAVQSVTESEGIAGDTTLANGSEREHLFSALDSMLRALHPNTTDIRMEYSMSRLRAILLRAAPRKDESRLMAHIFQNITQKLQAISINRNSRKAAD